MEDQAVTDFADFSGVDEFDIPGAGVMLPVESDNIIVRAQLAGFGKDNEVDRFGRLEHFNCSREVDFLHLLSEGSYGVGAD